MRSLLVVCVLMALVALTGLEVQAEMITSQSSSAPVANVVLSQTDAGSNLPWRYQQAAGTDNNPRDAGQTFFVDAGTYPQGLILDKVTVKLHTLNSTSFDSGAFVFGLYAFTDASDYIPDPDKDSPLFTESGTLPSTLKSAFGGGETYLTFDIADQTLSAGSQYGFLLMHAARRGGVNDNLLIAAKANSLYTQGTAIVRHNRGAGSDAFKQGTVWVSPSDQPVDLQFYLQGSAIPEPGTLALLGMALLGLGWYVWRRSRR